MSTITAILDADVDGTLHLPLPAKLRRARLKVTATIEPAPENTERPSQAAAMAALRELQARGTFMQVADPVAWQREIRQDRPLPARN